MTQVIETDHHLLFNAALDAVLPVLVPRLLSPTVRPPAGPTG